MTTSLPSPLGGVASRYYRSVRLEHDLTDAGSLDGYIVTPQVRQVVQRLEEGLRAEATERAWTITGPYGSGKSACALFLSHLLAEVRESGGVAQALLAKHDPPLAERLGRTLARQRLLPVGLTLRRAPLALGVLEGLRRAAARLPVPTASALLAEIDADPHAALDSRAVVRRLVALRDAAIAAGYHGLLLTLDELGKALEYAARSAGDDIYLLQEMAEVAARSGPAPVIVVGILHQAFEGYGERLDPVARREWAKIQGRFSDIAFLEPPEQQMRLAAAAVAAQSPQADAWHPPLAAVARALVASGHAPADFSADEFAALATQAAPLHPTVLAALPHLFRRLAQNERSLFAYLQSGEPFGLAEHLRARPTELVRLPDLYDYVAANLGGGLARHTAARRWLEAVDALERAPDLPPLEVAVLKAVGVLGILGDTPAVRPTATLLALALADRLESAEVEAALAALRARSLVVFRRYSQTYRIWEGSDVDVEAQVEEGRRRTGGQPGLAAALERFLPARPLVARRHSHQTGALRAFAVRYLDAPVDPAQLDPPAGVDGVVACAVPATPDAADRFVAWAAEPEVAALPHLLIVVPAEIGGLRSAADELRALRWAWEQTPELRDDRVARRELGERIAAVERVLADGAAALFDPRPAPLGGGARWFAGGAAVPVRTPAEVAALLSRVMDALYPATPRIWSELLNRRVLSSAAAAARRTLVERMLTQADRPLLGIEGYPPERSMYASLLAAGGLHRQVEGGWRIGPPPPDDPAGLGPAWAAMEAAIYGAGERPLPVNELFAQLAAPPYGVLPGVLPVLLTACLVAHADEISLYREGSLTPEPASADLAVLMRRPELFAVAGGRVAGERAALVQRLARGLGVAPATLPIVRDLLRRARALPEHAWRTRRLPPPTLALRAALERARSPERLLFEEIPVALGQAPFAADAAPDADRIGRFFDALNGALAAWIAVGPATTTAARDALLAACGHAPGEAGWAALRAEARALDPERLPAAVAPFVRRLRDGGEAAAALEGVLALVATRPPRAWTDADADRFPAQAAEMGERYRLAVRRVGALTEEEAATTAVLVARLRAGAGASTPPRLLRAALVRLLAELDEIDDREDR
jgi:hypothetical protein